MAQGPGCNPKCSYVETMDVARKKVKGGSVGSLHEREEKIPLFLFPNALPEIVFLQKRGAWAPTSLLLFDVVFWYDAVISKMLNVAWHDLRQVIFVDKKWNLKVLLTITEVKFENTSLAKTTYPQFKGKAVTPVKIRWSVFNDECLFKTSGWGAAS